MIGVFAFSCVDHSEIQTKQNDMVGDGSVSSANGKRGGSLFRDPSTDLYTGFNSTSGPTAFWNSIVTIPGIGTQVYSGISCWNIVDIKAVNFLGTSNPSLVSAFNGCTGASLYRTEFGNSIPVGSGTRFFTATAGESLVAITGGDFNGDGIEEMVTAIQTNAGPRMFIGNGTSIGTQFYTGSSYWTITSVTSGDFNLDGIDELVCAFNGANGPAFYNLKFSSTLCCPVWSRPYLGTAGSTISSVTATNIEGDAADELFVAVRIGGIPYIYKGNGATIGSPIFQGTSGQSIVHLEAGEFATGTSVLNRLFTAITTTSGSQIYLSDGSSLGTLYYSGSASPTIKTIGIRYLPS